MYNAELAKVIVSEQSGAGLHDTHVLKLFLFKPNDLTSLFWSFFPLIFLSLIEQSDFYENYLITILQHTTTKWLG